MTKESTKIWDPENNICLFPRLLVYNATNMGPFHPSRTHFPALIASDFKKSVMQSI